MIGTEDILYQRWERCFASLGDQRRDIMNKLTDEQIDKRALRTKKSTIKRAADLAITSLYESVACDQVYALSLAKKLLSGKRDHETQDRYDIVSRDATVQLKALNSLKLLQRRLPQISSESELKAQMNNPTLRPALTYAMKEIIARGHGNIRKRSILGLSPMKYSDRYFKHYQDIMDLFGKEENNYDQS